MVSSNVRKTPAHVNPFPPNGLTRSGIACWWSILNLIKESNEKGIQCFMWTLTFEKVYPDSWCGNMHRLLVGYLRDEARNRPQLFPFGFGGVRVVEVHPQGHGLHYHWVIRGRIPLSIVRRCARRAGFGHVFIARDDRRRFRAVDLGAAGYVAKYLTKSDKIKGVRSWSCIGDYNGTLTKNIEFDSRKNRVFRQVYRTAKLAGANPSLCYSAAVIAANRWEINADDRDPETFYLARIGAGAGQLDGTEEDRARQLRESIFGVGGNGRTQNGGSCDSSVEGESLGAYCDTGIQGQLF